LEILVSNVVLDELGGAPVKVKQFYSTINDVKKTTIILDEEAIQLAEAYLKEKVVGATSRADCYHIALATIHKADLLVSWNFKHIVNVPRINGYNSLNLKLGYRQLEIRSPREVFEYGN
jgi:(p)ppGpp synthase/HD superfamily hydrolase